MKAKARTDDRVSLPKEAAHLFLMEASHIVCRMVCHPMRILILHDNKGERYLVSKQLLETRVGNKGRSAASSHHSFSSEDVFPYEEKTKASALSSAKETFRVRSNRL
jgi:hypothetical protein